MLQAELHHVSAVDLTADFIAESADQGLVSPRGESNYVADSIAEFLISPRGISSGVITFTFSDLAAHRHRNYCYHQH